MTVVGWSGAIMTAGIYLHVRSSIPPTLTQTASVNVKFSTPTFKYWQWQRWNTRTAIREHKKCLCFFTITCKITTKGLMLSVSLTTAYYTDRAQSDWGTSNWDKSGHRCPTRLTRRQRTPMNWLILYSDWQQCRPHPTLTSWCWSHHTASQCRRHSLLKDWRVVIWYDM